MSREYLSHEQELERQSRASGPLIRLWALERLAGFFLIASAVAVFGLLISVIITARRAPDSRIAMAPLTLVASTPAFGVAAPPVATASATVPPPTRPPTATPSRTATASRTATSSRTATASITPTPSSTPDPVLIALVAGHSGGIDPGAICPDGLREVDVTTDVVTRTRTILLARGYRVDVLAEFDARLSTRRDYAPRAFLSVHADSCIKTVSGYKVARAANSGSADEDDRLVRCVTASYGAATGLAFHADSITADMTRYHAFDKINPKSPSGIIELGFLGSERDLLVNHRDRLAEGIANGLDDFMRGSACKAGQKDK